MNLCAFLALALGLTTAVRPQPFCACFGSDASAIEHLAYSDAVFIARPIDVRDARPPARGDSGLAEASVSTYGGPPTVAVLLVERRWKGPARDTVVVRSWSKSGLCGFDFVVGQAALVYASKGPSGELETTSCMGTKPFEKAGEDLGALGTAK